MSNPRRIRQHILLGWALVVAAVLPDLSASAEPILWRSGPTEVASKSPQEVRDTITALASRGEPRHFVVRFDGPLGTKERTALESGGLRLLQYLGGNAFFASLSKQTVDPEALTRTSAMVNVRRLEREWKLHSNFATGKVPPWAIVSETEEDAPAGPMEVGAYVLFHPDVPLTPDGVNIALRHGGVVRSFIRSVNGLVIELPISEIPALADEDAVQWIEPPLPPLDEVNDSVRENTQADIAQAPPYGLDGTGVNVLVYDGGTALANHVDFGGRLSVHDTSMQFSHPTHVSCTIGGDGTESDGLYRGMAPNVTLHSYGFEYDGSGIFLYNNPGDIESDYDEAINVYGAHIANNSIGTNTCSNGFDCEITGDYGVTAQLIDAIVHGSLGAPFPVVWANGNERNCSRCGDEGVHTPEGYHSTAPPACAKNSINVGALNSNDDSVTWFTSWGPTDDGRLKPDVSAPGCQEGSDGGVTSCGGSEGYMVYCGTSMAAPTVTGLTALLLQDFRAQFPGRPDPLNSTLKALLAHNASDLEEPGPDYKTGYGAVRIQNTIDFMRTDSFLEGEIDQGGEFMTLTYTLTHSEPVKITLAWDDVPGVPNVETALVNDLDLQVFDQDLNRYYPWTLDPENPSAPAIQTNPDRINNLEQVYVDSAAAGMWTIRVAAFNVPAGPQRFSLCVEPQLVEDCNSNGVPDVDEIQADPSLDCTGNGVLDECEPDCDGDGTADTCAIAAGDSTDCNFDFLPDDCEPWADCNGNDVFDPCDITEGGLPDCNANWVPDVCIQLEEDCNSNLVPDSCDIAAGTSADCDGNGLPDDCQDTSADCNDNGTWDACDISSGSSEDHNTNGIPDECEPNRFIYVDVDTCPDPGTGSQNDPYCKIQDAMDASVSGDIVHVADGTYAGDGQTSLNFRGCSMTVRSENGPENCIIDGEWTYGHRGFIFTEGETEDSVVDGFTILKAFANRGSGLFIDGAGPTIRNCQFLHCRTIVDCSGVIQTCNDSEPTLVNCYLSDCSLHAVTNGSGSRMTMSGCSLYYQGDGVLNFGEITAANCSFRNHHDAVRNWGHITLTDCSFSENHHGLITTGHAAELTGCTFVAHDDRAIWGGNPLTMSGCTIAHDPRTFVIPAGAGPTIEDDPWDLLHVCQTSIITDSVVRGNLRIDDGSTLIVTYSDMPYWNTADILESDCDDCTIELNEGVIQVDARFEFDDQGDPRLAPDSPCINAGDPGFYPLFRQTDIDGDPRILYGTVDMGADEAVEFLDCNNNRRPDWQDIAAGISADVNANGISDECEPRWARHVDDDAPSDPGPGDPTVSDPLEDGTRAHPFDSIQEAIDVAWDVVLVMDGIYTGEGNRDLNLRGRKLLVRSANGPLNCIIDPGGEGWGFVFRDGETTDSHIEGFTITNGRPTKLGGGAIFGRDSSPTIENCILAANRATWGGAILLENSSPRIIGCRFVGNHDNNGGGAIYMRPGSSPLISGCAFAGNTGAIRCLDCSAIIEDCMIVGNRSVDLAGGVSCQGVAASPTIRRCTIANNHVLPDRGGAGGLYVEGGADLSVFNTVLWGNTGSPHDTVRVDVGSVYFEYCDVEGGDPGEGTIWATGNINQDPLFPPRASGVWTADGAYDLQTHRVTLADSAATWQENELVGLFINPDTSRPWEFLIVANTATELQILPSWGTLDDGMSSVLAGAAYEVRDYHLPLASPCLNAGDPGYYSEGATDIDDEPRVEGGRVDMGSDEVHDCNQNSTPDYQDIARSTSEDCDANGIPDECAAWLDCNANGILDACDIREGTGQDCNENAVPDECDLADGTSVDLDLNAVPDECDIADGVGLDCNLNGTPDAIEIAEETSDDINGNGIPDECDADCQPNGVPDDWDLALGTSEDCNANGSPDECEWLDCNENDTFDGCDLSDGFSEDCNGNFLPDECEAGEHDCNENATPDNCDIGLVTSPDCQPNGIPDECELDGQDCNENEVPDDCDLESGNSSDCQPNGIPDECEPDCNANGVPDDCEVIPDTDGDGVDDCSDLCPCTPPDNFCICPDIDECCWLDGEICVPDYPRDLCIEQLGTPSCSGTLCQEGCLVVFDDCNGNGVPDIRDVSCYEYCDPPCGESSDCNSNAVPDECDIAAGTSTDENLDGVPDECELYPALSAPYPHNRARNRYLSFDPNPDNDGRDVAFKVTLKTLTLGSCDDAGSFDIEDWSCRTDNDCRACSVEGNPCWTALLHCSPGETCVPTGAHCVNDHAGSVGTTWWVGPAHPAPGRDVHLLVSEPYRKVSSAWPAVVHLADCEVVPLAVYGIRAVLATPEPEDPESESAELEVRTIARPDCWWADCVGELGMYCTGTWAPCTGDGDCPSGRSCLEQWPPPDGFINFHDITAAVFRFSMAPGSAITDVANLDLHGNDGGDAGVDPPNYAVNFADIANMISAFQGWPYPYSNPGDCPDIGTWP